MFRKVAAAAAGGAFAFGVGSVANAQYSAPQEISAKEFRPFPLLHRSKVSHDTQKLVFALPSQAHTLGMEVAGLVVTRCKGPDGKNKIRPYTPISHPDQKGTFELLIKKYPGGVMGTYLHDLSVGETVEFKGPFKKLDVKPNEIEHIGMVAGGTGITPMYQVIQYLLSKSEDNTKLSLVYANRGEEDILLKKELDGLARSNPRFSVYYVLSDAPYNWKGGMGFINSSMLSTYLPKPGTDNKVFVCGPPGMMKHVSGDKDFGQSPPSQGEVTGLLKELGYKADEVFKF